MRAVRILLVAFVSIVSGLVCLSSIFVMFGATAYPIAFAITLAAFLASSLIVTETLRGGRDVRWAAWLLLLVFGGPMLLGFFGSFYMLDPDFGLTIQENAERLNLTDEIQRQMREDLMQEALRKRWASATVVAALSLQLVAVILLRRGKINDEAT